ncbi:MAG: DUF1624 domain-containing protein [Negativicutes bacterium]|nr:DUF1624 domain-containing protein [Negativicutes bacterium]
MSEKKTGISSFFQMADSQKNRIWEIDALRGIAICNMVFCHLLYDLHWFYAYPIDLNSPWLWLPFQGAILFFILSGISSHFSRHTIQRGLQTGVLALLVSLVTWLVDYQAYVRFGTLHFLACAMLLTPLLKKLNSPQLAGFILLFFTLGFYFSQCRVSIPWLFPLGLLTADFSSTDYFAIFPNLGYYALGILLARRYYAERRSRLAPLPHTLWLQWMGQHSLFLYLAHQPLLLALLWLFSWFKSFLS